MNKIASFLVALVMIALPAQAGPRSPCYWTGSVAQCFPSTGIMLHDNREMRLGETTANGTDYVSLKAPTSVTTSYTMTWPAAVATGNDQFLLSSSSGTLSFSDTVTTAKTFSAAATFGADVRLRETGGGTDYIALQAPSSVASNLTYTLPATDGTDGMHLATNGGGSLNWEWNVQQTNSGANCTLSNSDGIGVVLMATTSSTNRTCTLPTASSNTNRTITVKKSTADAGIVTVSGTIDSVADIKLYKEGESVTVYSDGNEWKLVGSWFWAGTASPSVNCAANCSAPTVNNMICQRNRKIVTCSAAITVTTTTTNTDTSINLNIPLGGSAFSSTTQALGSGTFAQNTNNIKDAATVTSNNGDNSTLVKVETTTCPSSGSCQFVINYTYELQ